MVLWIFIAMVLGVGIAHGFPSFPNVIHGNGSGTPSLPIEIGLILMMYPPMARVDYTLLPKLINNTKILMISLTLNWIIGPVLMFLLAIFFMGDFPEYMTGLVLIGLASSIAMVTLWNDLAGGNAAYCMGLVALNTIFQVFAYGFYTWMFLTLLPPHFGFEGAIVDIPMERIIDSVTTYLGIPMALGFWSRIFLVKWKGEQWYVQKFLPSISPLTPLALLLTIMVIFSFNREFMGEVSMAILNMAIPLVLFFILMFVIGFFLCKAMGFEYEKMASVAVTATSNNFELSMAVAIVVFGLDSGQVFASAVGSFIEVCALILLVRSVFWLSKKYY